MLDKKLSVLLESTDADAPRSPARLQFRYFAAARAHFLSGLPAIAGGMPLPLGAAASHTYATTARATKTPRAAALLPAAYC